GGGGELPRFRVFFGQGANCGNLIIGPLYRPFTARAKQLRLDPDRKKLRVQAARFCAHRVEVAVAELFLQVYLLVKNALNGVGVHIDGYCAIMDSEGIVGRVPGHGLSSLMLVHLRLTAAGVKRRGAKKRNQK
ncbi:MAG TPA: hypothetical protein VLA17_05605, partial [Candidatus Limnocylindria bacterium]|nr:hypothetical protein [Candidatus Limnocylindria bacterium]